MRLALPAHERHLTPAFLIGCALFAAHAALVLALLFSPRRLGRESGDDTSRDPLFSWLNTAGAYAIIVAAHTWGLVHLHGAPGLAPQLAGAALFTAGLALRLWAVRTLGRFFTMQIGLRRDHELVESGPYRLLRHPSYTGYFLAVTGIGIAYQSWVALAVPLAETAVFLALRIPSEERMLAERFGESFATYRKRTWALLPFLL